MQNPEGRTRPSAASVSSSRPVRGGTGSGGEGSGGGGSRFGKRGKIGLVLIFLIIVIVLAALNLHSSHGVLQSVKLRGGGGGGGILKKGAVKKLGGPGYSNDAWVVDDTGGIDDPNALPQRQVDQFTLPKGIQFTGLMQADSKIDSLIPDGLQFKRDKYDYYRDEKELCDAFCDNFDVLYTYVNGSDYAHKLRKFIALAAADPAKVPFNPILYPMREILGKILHNNQDKDNDELKFSLRGLKKFLPWHRGKIYMVTPGHSPTWLDQTRNFFATHRDYKKLFAEEKKRVIQAMGHEFSSSLDSEDQRLIMVFQDAIVWESARLRFSSNNVEPHLYRTPNLSEMFVHVNDDYMFTAMTNISHFLNRYGGGNLYLGRGLVRAGYEQYYNLKKSGGRVWFCGVAHSMAVASDIVDQSVGPNSRYVKKFGYIQEKRSSPETARKINDWWNGPRTSPMPSPDYPLSPGNVTPRFYLKHSPFVYSRRILAYMDQFGVAREHFDNVKIRGRHCEDVYTPTLHHAIAIDAPWRGCDYFRKNPLQGSAPIARHVDGHNYTEEQVALIADEQSAARMRLDPAAARKDTTYSSLAKPKTLRLGSSKYGRSIVKNGTAAPRQLRLNQGNCPSPFTFNAGDASLSAFLFFKDNMTDKLDELNTRLDKDGGQSIKFTTINDGYKNQSTADYLHKNFFERRYPHPSVYEILPEKVEAKAASDRAPVADQAHSLQHAASSTTPVMLKDRLRDHYFGPDFAKEIGLVRSQQDLLLVPGALPNKLIAKNVDDATANLNKERINEATPMIVVVSRIDLACPVLRSLGFSLPLMKGKVHVIVEPAGMKCLPWEREYCLGEGNEDNNLDLLYFGIRPRKAAVEKQDGGPTTVWRDATALERCTAKRLNVSGVVKLSGEVTSVDLGFQGQPGSWRPKCYLHGVDPRTKADSDVDAARAKFEAEALVQFHFMKDAAEREELLLEQRGHISKEEASRKGVYDPVKLAEKFVHNAAPHKELHLRKEDPKAARRKVHVDAFVFPVVDTLMGQSLALEDFRSAKLAHPLEYEGDEAKDVRHTVLALDYEKKFATISFSSVNAALLVYPHPNADYEEFHPAWRVPGELSTKEGNLKQETE